MQSLQPTKFPLILNFITLFVLGTLESAMSFGEFQNLGLEVEVAFITSIVSFWSFQQHSLARNGFLGKSQVVIIIPSHLLGSIDCLPLVGALFDFTEQSLIFFVFFVSYLGRIHGR